MNKKRVASYLICSNNNPNERNRKVNAIKQYCLKNDYDLALIYNYSTIVHAQESFSQVLEDISDNNLDGIVFYNIDTVIIHEQQNNIFLCEKPISIKASKSEFSTDFY